MKTILRVDASSRTAGSQSRALGDYFEHTWVKRNPSDRIVRRDVVENPIPHIASQTITGFYTPGEKFTDELRSATALSDRLVSELRAADILLLTVPIYNFSIPSALKAWIDHIVRIGHTFAYDGKNFTGVAISPQTPDYSLTTQQKHDLKFPVLSDQGNKVARQFGLVFTVEENLKPIYKAFGIDLKAHNGDESYELPMPATYLVAKDGNVLEAFVNSDYRSRLEPETALAWIR